MKWLNLYGLAFVAALLFAPCHILISYRNAR